MILDEQNESLNYNSLRAVVKKAAWKLAVENQSEFRQFEEPTKQALMHYKFVHVEETKNWTICCN
jgi:hypothetical protein